MRLTPVPATKAATLLLAAAAVLTACVPAPSRGQVTGATASGSGGTSSSITAPVPARAGQAGVADLPSPDPAGAAVPDADPSAPSAGWTVTRVVDGDTIDVVRGGVRQKVRFIGIDAPEIGQCGYAEGTRNLQELVSGRAVTLVPGATTDRDRYGRLLRYVEVGAVDAGLRQVQGGFAIARYDSRDGYGAHPREAAYIAADVSSASVCPARSGPAAPTKSASPSPSGPAAGGWPLAGDRFPCPPGRPVKGNASSMIAHSPGQQSYLVTNPEQCFVDLPSALAAGYRAAKR